MSKISLAQIAAILSITFLMDGALSLFGVAGNANKAMAAEKSAVQTAADMETIQGTWKFVSAEYDGKPNPRKTGDLVTFSEGQVIFHKSEKDTGQPPDVSYKLDATKNPKQIDIIAKINNREFFWRGIYELDQNTLKYCIATPDQPRAMEYVTRFRDGRTLAVFDRVKP